MVFEEVISAGIVSIVLLTFMITVPGEAPLKRFLSKHAISKMFYYYATFYLTFACILMFWTCGNWAWKSATFQHYKIISKLEKRITKLLLLIILCVPCRYILRLMIVPPKKKENTRGGLEKIDELEAIKSKATRRQRGKSVPFIEYSPKKTSQPTNVRDSIDMKDIKDLLFGSDDDKNTKSSRKKKEIRVNKITPFQELEVKSTLYNVSAWNPLPFELFELVRIFQLFAKIRTHGQKNIPRDHPCLIIINHALGHGFDAPMIVYILRKYCKLSHVRVLVSPEHFNYPIWCDLVYYIGGAPRTHQVAERLMKDGENIIMFAAKKKKTAMMWDNQRELYLDLVHKYDYVLVPAVCVSDDDVINMVYNIREPKGHKKKPSHSLVGWKFGKQQENNQYDTEDTDNEDEQTGQLRTLKTMHGRWRDGYRKTYHLRFSLVVCIHTISTFCFVYDMNTIYNR